MLVINEVLGAKVLTVNKTGNIKGSDRLSDGSKYVEPKTRRSESQKLAKSQKLSKSRKSKGEKSKKPSKSGNLSNFDIKNSGSSFLTPKARSAFNRLRLTFTEALILWYFDLKCYIWIKTNISGYIIGGVLSQLASKTSPDGVVTKADLSQWYSVAFFSRKMILAETYYKTHNGKLLAIVEAFKTWCYYLEGYKHEFFVLTDYNNFCHFMDIKSLSSQQVRWA